MGVSYNEDWNKGKDPRKESSLWYIKLFLIVGSDEGWESKRYINVHLTFGGDIKDQIIARFLYLDLYLMRETERHVRRKSCSNGYRHVIGDASSSNGFCFPSSWSPWSLWLHKYCCLHKEGKMLVLSYISFIVFLNFVYFFLIFSIGVWQNVWPWVAMCGGHKLQLLLYPSQRNFHILFTRNYQLPHLQRGLFFILIIKLNFFFLVEVEERVKRNKITVCHWDKKVTFVDSFCLIGNHLMFWRHMYKRSFVCLHNWLLEDAFVKFNIYMCVYIV